MPTRANAFEVYGAFQIRRAIAGFGVSFALDRVRGPWSRNEGAPEDLTDKIATVGWMV